MENTKLNELAQKIINTKLNNVKYSVRRVYRSSTNIEKLSSIWIDKLSEKTHNELKDVLKLVDGSNSILNVAIAAMNGKILKASC